MDLINRIQNQLNNNWSVEATDIQKLINYNKAMKYIIITLINIIITLTIATATNAQTSTTYEASVNHFSASYDYTPDSILYASLAAGHKDNTYGSARITVKPLNIETKFTDIISIEPFAFFEYGYNGSAFNNYGLGVSHKITKKYSVSAQYSQWGISASITLLHL